MRRHNQWWCALAIIYFVLLPAGAWAQDKPAEQPKEEPQEALETQDVWQIDFKGGTARDLAAHLQEISGTAFAVAGVADKPVPAFAVTVRDRMMMDRLVGYYAQVMIRPGYCLAKKDQAAPATQPTDFNRDPRPAEEKRDQLPVVGLKADAVIPEVALKEISTYARMPIVTDGELPKEPMAFDIGDSTVAGLIEALAEKMGMKAKAVHVVFGLTPDNIAEAFEYVTDEELLDRVLSQTGLFASMSPEMRQGMLEYAYGEFRKMSPQERAGIIKFMSGMFGTVFGRVRGLGGPEGESARNQIRGFMDDALAFYQRLPANERGEVQPIADLINRIRQGF